MIWFAYGVTMEGTQQQMAAFMRRVGEIHVRFAYVTERAGRAAIRRGRFFKAYRIAKGAVEGMKERL